MRDAIVKNFKRLVRCEEGVTLVEYGIGVTLAVAVGTLALTNLGNAIIGKLGQAAALMP